MSRAETAVVVLTIALLCSLRGTGAVALEPIAAEVASFYNLVENGGFEEGGLLPAYWQRHPPEDLNGHRLLRDTTVAHWGKASGLISGAHLAAGTAGPNLQWNRYGIKVEGGSALILSCYTKTEGVRPLRVGCHIYAGDRRHLGFKTVDFPQREGEWVFLGEEVPVPDEAQRMGFVMYAGAPEQTWYDDVVVLGTPSTRAAQGTPKLDGKLDDPCWVPGQAITQFAVHTGTRLPREKTKAWLTQPETRAVRDEIQRLASANKCLRLLLDFHSTGHDVVYTQRDSDKTVPEDFTRQWLEHVQKKLPDYHVRRERSHGDALATAKSWGYETFRVPAITYEVGDSTDRSLIRSVACTAAEALMHVLLRAAAEGRLPGPIQKPPAAKPASRQERLIAPAGR